MNAEVLFDKFNIELSIFEKYVSSLNSQFNLNLLQQQNGLNVVKVSGYTHDILKHYQKLLKTFKKLYINKTNKNNEIKEDILFFKNRIIKMGNKIKALIKKFDLRLLPKSKGKQIINLTKNLEKVSNTLLSV